MVWQDAVSSTGGPAFDAESERERRLAAQARAGAEWALTALVARYQPTVVRYLTRLCGNPTQAHRLAERIFQRMERRLHGPHGAENLRLWLLRACTEAGLDALRHPTSAPAPRLAASEVVGLLTDESGKESPRFLPGRLQRLRRKGGAVSRQARPLVWGDAPASAHTDAATEAPLREAKDSHLDETLDRLDPRDALRHRLVRVTLAELPYGDAQCLALHLVAGLNQAEVAKALGITNSAARKRMVHGLALFSDRYSQAVQSLGLPMELGFGDARPRSPIEPEPVAEAAPEPIVVSSQASTAERSAPGEDRLVEVNPGSDRGRDALSGVSYISEDSVETAAVMPDSQARPEIAYNDRFDGAETDHSSGMPDLAGAAAITAFDVATEHAYHPVTVETVDAESEVDGALVAEQSPAPVSGGLITRVAADAIIGPVVDALPVSSAPPTLPEGYGLAAPRSVPLAYELRSNAAHEPQGITMNWHDNSGQMTPLTFEAMAVSTGSLTPLAEAEPLAYEAVAQPDDAALPDEPASAEYDALGYEPAQTSSDEAPPEPPAELTPVEEPVDEPMELAPDMTPEPITVPVLSLPDDQHADDVAATSSPEEARFGARHPSGAITRSLEALWDELSDELSDDWNL